MKRPYIICHMMASIDGRIDCDMTEKIESGDEYYEALDELNLTTTISGRITSVIHHALPGSFTAEHLTPINAEKVHKAVDAPGYDVVCDSKGTLLWPDNNLEGTPLICAVSEQASQEYLDYLAAKGISYIATGKASVDLCRLVEILAENFGVERVGVVGGGKMNGGFLAAGLLDEMSLMIAPGIDGRSDQPSVFDGIQASADPVNVKLTHCKAYENGTTWLRYKFNK